MSKLTVKDVNEDLNMLLSCFGEQSRDIPSFGDIASKSVLVPLVSVCASIIGVVFFYASGLIRHPDTVDNFGVFFFNEGWYPVAASAVVGLLFFAMCYTNLTLYVTIPQEVREKSVLVQHMVKLVRKSVMTFFILIGLAACFTALEPALIFAIPVGTFIFLFVINIVISLEINRLGMGPALEKLSALVKKI